MWAVAVTTTVWVESDVPSMRLLRNKFVRVPSINWPRQISVVGEKSYRGRLALTISITPLLLVRVAVLPARAVATRESVTAVVKSNARRGKTRSVAVGE